MTSAQLAAKGAFRIILFHASKQIKEVIALLFPPEKFFLFADSEEEIIEAFAG